MAEEKKEAINKNEILRKLIVGKLQSIEKEKFEQKSLDRFSLVFRAFLLRYLNLNYEFTQEELFNEMEKRKVHSKLRSVIIHIVSVLTEALYEDKEISEAEFKSLLKEAKSVVNSATAGEKEKIEAPNKTKRTFFGILQKIGLAKTKEEREKGVIKEEKQKKQKRLEEKEKLEEKKKKSKEKKKKEELKKKKNEERKKRILGFLHKLGLIKTEEEKKQLERQREELKKKEEAKRRKEESIASQLKAEQKKEEEKNAKKIRECREIIKKGYGALAKSNVEESSKIYLKAMNCYLALPERVKEKIFRDISAYYKKLLQKKQEIDLSKKTGVKEEPEQKQQRTKENTKERIKEKIKEGAKEWKKTIFSYIFPAKIFKIFKIFAKQESKMAEKPVHIIGWKDSKDELTRINGIDNNAAKALINAGIIEFSDLASINAKKMSEKTGIKEKTLEQWKLNAQNEIRKMLKEAMGK
ncbi:hypothetical protein HYX01_03455 [Candidatus Woesearchaeota archaeon]|nr:hypothetical protein [Candidatus Woesearchaeota archaeon]